MTQAAVLLLGGNGFIGRALAQRLSSQGTVVHTVGRHNAAALEPLLAQCGTVVHLASSTTPGASASQAALETDNLQLTLRLLDLLQQRPRTHLVYFSSGGTVYGNPSTLPVTEDAPLAPVSNHGAAKVAQEGFCLALRAQGHAVTIVRPSNAYGPGQTLKSGFGLVRTLLEHARSGTPLSVWGDGENLRDYLHIDDLVDATLALIQSPVPGGIFNLGSGVGHSVNQVRALVEAATGLPIAVRHQAPRGVDVRAVVLDCTRLQTQQGWQPRVDLAAGIASTWQWLQGH